MLSRLFPSIIAENSYEQAWRFVWLPRLLLVAPILLTIAIANFIRPSLLIFIILGLIGSGAAIFLLRHSFFGLVLLVFSTVMLPVSVGTGTASTISLPILLVGGLTALWLFQMFAAKREIHFLRSRPIVPALGLVVVAGLAFGVGQFPWYPTEQAPLTAQLGGLGLFVLSVAAFLLAAHQIEQKRQLERLVWLFIICGTVLIVSRFLPFLPIRRLVQPTTGSVFITCLVALAFSQAMLNRQLSLFKRGLLFVVVGLSFMLTLVTLRAWASGWVPAGISLLVILWVARPRFAFIVTLFALVIFVSNFETIFTAIFVNDNNAYSLDTRLLAWQIVAEIAKVNPLLGLGPANYYYYTPLYDIAGFNVQFNSHNQYIDLFAQTGALGLIFFGWWGLAIAKVGLKLRAWVAPAGFEFAFVCGVLGTLAGCVASGMLGDWVLPFVYNVGLAGFASSVLFWFFAGSLLAIEKHIES